MTDASTQIQVVDDIRQINLRGNADDKAFVGAINAATGLYLPVEANTFHAGDHRILWLGPDEWLIVTDESSFAGLSTSLAIELQDQHAAVNDVSGGQVLLRLDGDNVRDVLARGCTLDFHPDVFQPGMCAQSRLAKASVILALADDGASFDVIVRRSFSDYLMRWLERATAKTRVKNPGLTPKTRV